MESDGQRTVLVAGATGAVGKALMEELLRDASVGRVIVLSRRPIAAPAPKVTVEVIDFEQLDQVAPIGCEDVFCCLGTTLKKAGSKQAFRRVDADYVAALGRLGRRSGARQFLLVSAAGTSASSPSFYSRVKAEAEAALMSMSYPSLQIFRPSILLAQREESRPGEAVGIAVARTLGPLLKGKLSRVRGIEPGEVARAMAAAARRHQAGCHVYHYAEMQALIQGAPSPASAA